jgi:hypothetical protein
VIIGANASLFVRLWLGLRFTRTMTVTTYEGGSNMDRVTQQLPELSPRTSGHRWRRHLRARSSCLRARHSMTKSLTTRSFRRSRKSARKRRARFEFTYAECERFAYMAMQRSALQMRELFGVTPEEILDDLRNTLTTKMSGGLFIG